MKFKSLWCWMLGGLQVLVQPRLLLRPAMVVVIADDVTLDLWAPLLRPANKAATAAGSPCNPPTIEEVIDHLAAHIIDLPSGDGGVSS